MAQSVSRKIKRGHVIALWNGTFQKMDFFRKTKRGGFILSNPFSNKDLGRGTYPASQIAAWKKAQEEAA